MIAVIDFGSQYTHLITRRIRELGVRAEIFEHDVKLDKLRNKEIEGIILSGGPNSVYEKNSPSIDSGIFNLNLPILGICYGLHLIAKQTGGEVKSGKTREYGEKIIQIESMSELFAQLPKKSIVWFSHGDEVTKLPAGFRLLAKTTDCPIAAFADEDKKIYAIQFHPEVTHTEKGNKILSNFLFRICKAKKTWQISNVAERLIFELKNKVGDKHVMIGVSGGVDSMVAATLLNRAIKDNLYCVFIDTGMMRKNEGNEVEKMFSNLKFKNFIKIEAESEFIRSLKNVVDPEEKRKKFAEVYFRLFKKEAEKLKKEKMISFLAQGTIYPDRIEAGKTSKAADVIKTHHNLSTPSDFGFEILEPLGDFYKDEVRRLGIELDIPKEYIDRHPFPGPGLLIRILGEVTKERIELLREVDKIFIDELKKNEWYDKIWQAFAALLPVKSVGVMGDSRTYQYMIVLRAVTSNDAMTADWARIPENLLNKISKRITNEIKGINRVLFDITQKPPATIEYE